MEETNNSNEITDISNIYVLDVSNISFRHGQEIANDDNESYGDAVMMAIQIALELRKAPIIDMILHEKT